MQKNFLILFQKLNYIFAEVVISRIETEHLVVRVI